MGLSRRMRTRPQPRVVIDAHNRHDPKACWHKIHAAKKKANDKRWREEAAEAFRLG